MVELEQGYSFSDTVQLYALGFANALELSLEQAKERESEVREKLHRVMVESALESGRLRAGDEAAEAFRPAIAYGLREAIDEVDLWSDWEKYLGPSLGSPSAEADPGLSKEGSPE